MRRWAATALVAALLVLLGSGIAPAEEAGVGVSATILGPLDPETEAAVTPGPYSSATVGDVEVVFESATSYGVLTVIPIEPTAEDPPLGFRYGTDTYAYYEISTTATYEGDVFVTLHYDPTGMTAEEEAGLTLQHFVDGAWVDITVSRDLVQKTITGVTDSFSVFALFTPNTPPVADPGGPYAGAEGAAIGLDGTGSRDANGDSLAWAWDLDSDGDFDDATTATPTWVWPDDGSFAVGLRVTDAFGMSDEAATTAEVSNVPPSPGPIETVADPVEVGTEIVAQVAFDDPGVLDTHIASWDWGDGTSSPGSVIEVGGSGTAFGSHAYESPGVYAVTATITDKDGGIGTRQFEYVVAYDSDAGFVTGGGWIDSPAGAYYADPTASGTANFGFVSRYKRGAKTPDGNARFQFRAGDLVFQSDVQQWLVVNRAATNAQFKCTGTVNGEDGPGPQPFDCMIWAGDGNGPDGADTFRVRIWYEDEEGFEHVVYDNGVKQAIGGGSIVVRTK
jgi:hypothetical protein